MANVDLMGGDAQRIRNQYKTSLLRDAGDDEVTGWLSGSYGGGGIDQWLNQISSSDEARQRGTYKQPTDDRRDNPVVTGPSPGESSTQPSPYFPQSPDLPTYSRETGWSNQPPAATNSPWDMDPKGDFANWFLRNTGGMAPSGRALEGLAPQLSKYGIKLGGRNAQGMIDTIVTPDGRAWDVIESATMDGGKRWQWIPAGGSGGGGTNTGVGGGPLPGNQYTDQYTQLLESLIKSRIGQLQSPYDDRMRQQYEQGLQQRANSLGAANTHVTQLMDFLQKRFTDLQGDGYTGAEHEVIRTGALDPIETDRAAAKQRVLERISARGLTPDSGIAQQMLLEVDKAFDAMRGTTQTTLTTNDLNRREDRKQRAAAIGGQLVDIPEARAREQLDVFQALEILAQTARGEDEARSREAINYAGGLNDLTAQRLQMAMSAAGMGGNPSSLMSGLTSIANLNQNAALLNQRNSGSMWSGLGSVMAILAGSR